MIRSFKDKRTLAIWEGNTSPRMPLGIQTIARRKLRMISSARRLGDLRIPPANRLEKLKGDRRGQYSIRVSDRWRVCFFWQDGDAIDVEIVDYHR